MRTQFGKEAGIQGYKTNHSLRATATTRLYESRVDEQQIMERTGQQRLEGVRSYRLEGVRSVSLAHVNSVHHMLELLAN